MRLLVINTNPLLTDMNKKEKQQEILRCFEQALNI